MIYRLTFLAALILTFAASSGASAHHCVDQGGTLEGNCAITMNTGPESRNPGYDPDGDGIPNRLDACPYEFALDPSGCRGDGYDSDGDGLPDAQDWCPTLTAGGVTSGATGCPGQPTAEDADADGVPDSDDLCPLAPGSVLAGGCPDYDGDGVPDTEDACPHLPGIHGGCPDTDGDGVHDALDQCPTRRGSAANNGCPGSRNGS